MTMTTWQFTVELLKYFWFVWALGILCWVIIIREWVISREKKRVKAVTTQARRIQIPVKEASEVASTVSQEESVGEFLTLHPN